MKDTLALGVGSLQTPPRGLAVPGEDAPKSPSEKKPRVKLFIW